jgi:SAM-dependent methyltransferase
MNMAIETQSNTFLFAERCRGARCRSCGGAGLAPVLDLGQMPLSDRLVTDAMIRNETEPRFPLELAFCRECALVQILETVPPEVLFDADYPYYSSFSAALLKHSRENALELIELRTLGRDSLVIELASNDGYLLKNFVEHGIPVLGIDPAPGPAAAAEKVGVPTRNTFFTETLARQLVAEDKSADVIIANNVLAHVADTNGFVRGIAKLLKPTGVAVIEVPYVRDLIEHTEFDTIYHEHLCYFSVTALDNLFQRNGLWLNEVRRLPIHGGSLRLYIEPVQKPRPNVDTLLDEERNAGMTTAPYYATFAERVESLLEQVRAILRDLKTQGKGIAAYGAAAKGAIMLNALGLGADTYEFVVDRNVHKQGKRMPGVNVPILDPGELLSRMPDYTLILPWNFKDEILEQQAEYRKRGGKFIVPIPKPAIV